MKICVQIPVKLPYDDPQSKHYYDTLEKHLNSVKRDDTEILIRDVATGVDVLEMLNYAGSRIFNDLELLKSVLAAGREGVDAVSISCFFDPMLHEARQLLKIPVTGIAESSIYMACMMGRKFAMITAHYTFIPEMEEHISRYGVSSKAIKRNPVRALTLAPEEMGPIEAGIFQGAKVDYSPLVENFHEIAQGCIEDGAEVIIAGCGGISVVLGQLGLLEVNGASVIEPMIAGVKFAEMMVDMKNAGFPFVSRKLSYTSIPDEIIARL